MAASMSASAYPLSATAAAAPVLASYDRPNALYFFYLPAILVAAGLLAWFIPNNTVFMLCTLVGSMAAVLCLWDLVILEGPVRFSRISAMTLLLGYALGGLNSWYTIPRGSMTLGQFFIQNTEALARAQGAVLFACAILLSVGEIWERPLFRRDFKLDFDSRVISFCVASTLITLLAYATHSLSFTGAVIGPGYQLGVFPTLAMFVIGPAFGFTVAAALARGNRSYRIMLVGLAVVQVLCIFPQGRRTFLYSLIIALVCTRFSDMGLRISISRKLLALALAGGLFYGGNVVFFYMRFALQHQRTHLVSITQIGRAALTTSQQTQSQIVLSSLHKNEQTRTFILGYFSDVLEASFNHPQGHGLDLLHQLIQSTPRVLYPAKSEGRYFAEEQIAADLFGLNAADQANSILTGGAIDFGLAGALIYPIVLALLSRAYIRMFWKYVPAWVGTAVVLALVLAFLQPEDEFGGIFVTARNSALFALLLLAFAAMPRFRVSLSSD